MMKQTVRLAIAALLVLSGIASAADSPKAPSPVKAAKAKTAPKPKAPALGDAFIAGNVLTVRLNRPASITVFNSRGEQVFHLENARSAESFPLAGQNAGFLYLTLRSGKTELTKKLVHTGK